MLKLIDNVLNRITMYRLILYYLVFLLGVAVLMCFAGILPYDPFTLLFSTGFLVAACGITNRIFARTFRVPANVESGYISALILALILTPAGLSHDLIFLGWAAVWAMASKYIVAINRKHLFNPVAFAVAFTALTIDQSASWWAGTAPLLPFVLIGGLLVVRKIQRFDLVFSFLIGAVLTITAFGLFNGDNLIMALQKTLLDSPLLFFAFVFITEPLTTPPTRRLQIVYGLLVGFLFAPQVHIGSLYLTPELAILIGNVFSYLVSPKTKLLLRLKQKIQIAPDTYDFIFAVPRRLAFAPGQYMEWTLGHADPDTRGNRRYFTMASSPTEDALRVGIKFPKDHSSYKRSMLAMDENSEIVAAQIAGDFTLPADPNLKCVFIAGGIGITPFRSMIKYLLDTHQKRSITLIFANPTVHDVVYKDVWDDARRQLRAKIVYTLTDMNRVPTGWTGEVGHIDARMIQDAVPDYRDCVFYISGPNRMVNAVKDVLASMNVSQSRIKSDFFPGFA